MLLGNPWASGAPSRQIPIRSALAELRSLMQGACQPRVTPITFHIRLERRFLYQVNRRSMFSVRRDDMQLFSSQARCWMISWRGRVICRNRWCISLFLWRRR